MTERGSGVSASQDWRILRVFGIGDGGYAAFWFILSRLLMAPAFGVPVPRLVTGLGWICLALVGCAIAAVWGLKVRRASQTYLLSLAAGLSTVALQMDGASRIAAEVLADRSWIMIAVGVLAVLIAGYLQFTEGRERLRHGRRFLLESGRLNDRSGYWDLRVRHRLEPMGMHKAKERRMRSLLRVLMSFAPATGFLLSRNLDDEGLALAFAVILYIAASAEIWRLPGFRLVTGLQLREWERELGKPIVFPPNEAKQAGA